MKFDSCIKNTYRNVFIVDSLRYWKVDVLGYEPMRDIVLTYDLAMYKYIKQRKGDVFYLDHTVHNEVMQKNNFLIYEFFKSWHLDKSGKDIFTYKGVPFGRALQVEFWNDYTAYIRTYLSLSVLKRIKCSNIYVGTGDDNVRKVLRILGFDVKFVDKHGEDIPSFYFPISQWMNEKLRPQGFRAFLYKARDVVSRYYGVLLSVTDRCRSPKKGSKGVFIQDYHPTREIIKLLRSNKNIRVILQHFSKSTGLRGNLSERLVPIAGQREVFNAEADALMAQLKSQKVQALILDDGSDVTKEVFQLIEYRVSEALPKAIRILDSCIQYIDENKVDLEVLIANIGTMATLFDCVCKVRGIPSYLIINGLMGPAYGSESKCATFINAYSESIKNHYFSGMENIVTLGDPRMDMYPISELKKINRVSPTVTIGASGFNNVDLNSYVAVEFDFMHDVLSAFSIIKDRGMDVKLIVKVRNNGYRALYESFVSQYFSNLDIEIMDTIPMKKVLQQSDFYISIYSQTLFEASCLGIPVVYYKKDTEIMFPPFDGHSELETVEDIEGLVQAFGDFINNDERYNTFLRRDIMEKYVGPLDGRNLQRNIDYIHDRLEKTDD